MSNKLYTNQGTVLEPLLKELNELAVDRPNTEEIEQLDNEIRNLSEQSRILNQVMKKRYMDSVFLWKAMASLPENGQNAEERKHCLQRKIKITSIPQTMH